MSKGVLIANRGEIAVRIARSVREMGYDSISVFSEADRLSLHVLLSDRAFFLGPSDPEESYLNVERIIEIAKRSRATLIHPGYGFLAENPVFAEELEKEGLTFIGPSSGVLRLVGDKVEARKTAEDRGVPVVPGSRILKDGKEALDEARKIGFPVLLKAALGGGGKGMRIVEDPDGLESSFRLAQQESQGAFGDSSIYLEKFLLNPRHIEIQMIADSKGNVLCLGERECSIQRRHQKIIEESPSPGISENMRKDMMDAAVTVFKAVGYTNAGTVEFLVDGERFYFLEVNARLQVEHPVTEMRFGIDLVKEQINVAEGGKIEHLRGIEPRGHSIEARIYAEDPENDFYPSPGRIVWMREPGGPFVRVDSGIYPGFEVSLHYDPLLSKVIAWGEKREVAIKRLLNALREYRIVGITTNIPFHRSLLAEPRFLEGDIGVDFLRDFKFSPEMDTLALGLAGIVTGTIEREGLERGRGGPLQSLWKLQARKALYGPADWELL